MMHLLNVRKVFNAGKPNEFSTIQGINLKIVPQSVTVFMGPSGSGKTTLLSLIGRMARPTAGRLTRDRRTLRIMNGAYNMPVLGGILSTEKTQNPLDFLSTRKKSGLAIGKQQWAVQPCGPLTHGASHASEEPAAQGPKARAHGAEPDED
ncbi:MAG: ATP-binding cassette domain-containing protein [Syntrophobacteraceae bacterium]|nr:ATP-binding cassette domain-containing protein [Syntrophobacteraceae bacterium]